MVFEAAMPDGEYVIRISDTPDKINFYIKEQWAVSVAREKGIPVPEILEVGIQLISKPYMVVRKTNGIEATHHPDRLKIIREMGNYAAIIHSIPTIGYGHIFNWSENTLSKNETWKEFLQNELKLDERLEILDKYKMLHQKDFKKLKAILLPMTNWREKPSLNHGDIRTKNILIDDKGKISAILDWENCISTIAPYWDLSISLHGLNIDEKQQFLSRYGIKEKEFSRKANA